MLGALLVALNFVYYSNSGKQTKSKKNLSHKNETLRSLPIIKNHVSKEEIVTRDLFHPKLPPRAKPKPKEIIAKPKVSKEKKKKTLDYAIRLVGILQHGQNTIAFLKVNKLPYSAKLGDTIGPNNELTVTAIDRARIELTNSSTGQVKQLYLVKK